MNEKRTTSVAQRLGALKKKINEWKRVNESSPLITHIKLTVTEKQIQKTLEK